MSDHQGNPANDTDERRIIFLMRLFNKERRRIMKTLEIKEAVLKDHEGVTHIYYTNYDVDGAGFFRFSWNLKDRCFDSIGLGKYDRSCSPPIIYKDYPMPEYKDL